MNLLSKSYDALLQWVDRFIASETPTDLFAEHAIWRDYLAFAWDLQSFEGIASIAQALPCHIGDDVTICETPSSDEVIFSFHGAHGPVKALAEIHNGLCVRLFTSLEDMTPRNHQASKASGLDEPEVLIIGAGQSGLALAAQLQHLGVPYLVAEQNTRIGDNWRNRYDSLILHDPVWVNHLPFKSFPDDWPTFTPKEKMGDWLEDYAMDLALNVTCNCTITAAHFDDDSAMWQVTQEHHGKPNSFSVPHIVFAVGTSGFAHKPHIKGADLFHGKQMHSSAYRSGTSFARQSVAIIGATNSAHDIAVDLVKHGAKPTLIQRSSTHVVPHQVYLDDILAPLYGPKHNRALADADFLSAATPMRRLEEKGRMIFAKAQQEWHSFYENLKNTGFALDFAEDGSGIIGKYRRSASGYYIDVGGSQHVIDGRISVITGKGVKEINANGITLDDNRHLACDAIIYATGFGSMEEWVARLIDQKTADKIGRCWGYGSGYRGDPGPWEGELRNMWKPTAQQGLWFMGGNLAQVRIYSRYLAMQLCHHTKGA
ncbi:MAG: flavin-containing monooxygenase [Candidatus Puniceispirillaceae bacterium]